MSETAILTSAGELVRRIETSVRSYGSRPVLTSLRLRVAQISDWAAVVEAVYLEAGQERLLEGVLPFPILTTKFMGRDLVIECDERVATSQPVFRITVYPEFGPGRRGRSRVLMLENTDFAG